jgi:hypothetical protein
VDLGAVLDALAARDSEDVLRQGWEEALASMPHGTMPFLRPDYVAWACEAAFLPPEMARAAAEAALRISGNDPLRLLAWYCHDRLFRRSGAKPEVRRWPALTGVLGRDAGMFYVLVLLSGTPEMQDVHRARAIPDRVARDTVLDLKRCMEKEDFFQQHGRWGISPRILAWLMHSWRGDLYHLTRLQFVPDTFRCPARAFRHRHDGTVIALSEAGIRYRPDGDVDWAGALSCGPDAWTSTLEAADSVIAGFPIHPRGYAVRKLLRLDAALWECALAPGDPVLAIHVPVGPPPMTHELCGQSIREALDFFPRHFPDRPAKGLVCASWFLDRQFEEIMPPSSNVVRFQQEMYLLPAAWEDSGTLKAVFGYGTSNLAGVQCSTSMQRAVARHMAQGGRFRGGMCFLLARDLCWGARHYRNQDSLLLSQ